MTRGEIELEADTSCADSDFSPHGRPSIVAWLEYCNGLPNDQKCPYCLQLLHILDHGSAWTVTCPCGKSENAFRGL